MKSEVFKPYTKYLIPGTNEAMFWVSNYGRIRSHKGSDSYIISNIHPNSSGYLIYQFSVFGKRRSELLHRMVMHTFKGPSKKEVNHLDGDKLNNKLDNLEYCSRKQNIQHAVDNGLYKPAKGEGHHLYGKTGKNHHRSITIQQFNGGGQLINTWESMNLIQENTKYKKSHISKCIKEGKPAYGFIWKKA